MFPLKAAYRFYFPLVFSCLACQFSKVSSQLPTAHPVSLRLVITTEVHSNMTYFPSAQAKKGDGYLDEARNLRDQWGQMIPSGDLTTVQNRITMATEMRHGLDGKIGFSKISDDFGPYPYPHPHETRTRAHRYGYGQIGTTGQYVQYKF
ncbi:hypothetical protein EDB89DRAFT_220696 [Lactarius sanguifluus]|nr:hypothetical protein EDB89DRAFT_220696 [Lactarius sanguifluus]